MKYLNELTSKELETVFYANNEVQETVCDRMYQEAMFWINEYLHGAKGIDYSLGCDRGSFFKITNLEEARKWIEESQHIYELFDDKFMAKVNRAYDIELKLYYDDMPEYMADGLQEEYDELENEINETIFYRLQSEWIFTTQDEIDYFTGYFDDVFQDCYVDEHYRMYKDIAYTKCYA